MKYLGKVLVFLFVLSLLIGCISFPASAVEANAPAAYLYISPDEAGFYSVTVYFDRTVSADGTVTYDIVDTYTFPNDQGIYNSWLDMQDIMKEGRSFHVDNDGLLLYSVAGVGSFYIFDGSHRYIRASDAIVSGTYPMEFDLNLTLEIVTPGSDDVAYRLISGKVDSRELSVLAETEYIFTSYTLGLCKFRLIEASDGTECYILCADLDASGNYSQAYVLGTAEGKLICPSDGYMLSSYESLYMVELCVGDVHNWSAESVIREPTCEEEGYAVSVCSLCYARKERLLDPLGHDYGFVNLQSSCSRCGADKSSGEGGNIVEDIVDGAAGVVNGIGNAFNNALSGIFGKGDGNGSSSGDGEAAGNYENGLEWAWAVLNGDEAALAGLKAFGDSLLTIVLAIVGVILFFLLIPVIRWIVTGITYVVKTLASLFGDLTESLKKKKKK